VGGLDRGLHAVQLNRGEPSQSVEGKELLHPIEAGPEVWTPDEATCPRLRKIRASRHVKHSGGVTCGRKRSTGASSDISQSGPIPEVRSIGTKGERNRKARKKIQQREM